MRCLLLSMSLLAESRGDPLSRPELIWGTLGLTFALLVGAVVIYLADKWRKRITAESRDDTAELTSFRAMYEAGEITETEYAELKRRMAEKVRKTPAAPAPSAAPEPTPSVPPAKVDGTSPTTPAPAPPSSLPPPSTA